VSLARVHNLAFSLDGFGTGAGQTKGCTFRSAGERDARMVETNSSDGGVMHVTSARAEKERT
jgi:hypothetical protein